MAMQPSISLNNIGGSLAELGKPAEAMVSHEKALAIWQKLVDANSNDIMFQFWLAFCYKEIGEVLAQTGKPEEALKSHEKARALLVKPTKANPAFHWVQSERADSLVSTGLLLSVSGETEKALAACEESLAIRQKLTDAHSGLAMLRDEVADSLKGLGSVQRRAGRNAEASASFRRAIALVEQLPTRTPRDYYSLACCHSQLAGIAAESGSGLTVEQRMAETERAMAALRHAVAGGYGGIYHLRTDASLDALRPRADFKKLVKEVEENTSKTLLKVVTRPRPK
jgi:tetratricopeptide (TPR) repeat protein